MEENISKCMNWIRKNESYLLEKYKDKYVLVKDDRVRSVSESKQEIIKRGIKRFGRGNFVTYYVFKDDMMSRIISDNESLLGDLKSFLLKC
jgi:hypothetical protein